MSIQLSLKNISVSFGQVRILKNISFVIEPGQTVGVIGPNGSGKTTLFNAISGFAPLQDGSMYLGDKEITNIPAHKRALLGLGRVFQNFGVFLDMTVEDNIRIALESSNQSSARLDIIRHLEEVSLENKIKDKAGSLSGGQKRLLEIARTIAFGAKVFLFDEPTAGVSPKMKKDLLQAIERVKLSGASILIIEHDMGFIAEFCEKFLVLNQGELIMEGNPSDVRNSAEIKELYFGV